MTEAKTGKLADLYRAHSPDALRLAYLLTQNRVVAEDIVQEAFARVIGRFAHLRSQERFGGYLYRTVVNLCRRHHRRAAIEGRYRHTQLSPTSEPPRSDHIDNQDHLWKALVDLPLRQRTVIFMSFYRDLSEAQIADALGCSSSAVRSLKKRAMAQLRNEVQRG